MARLADRQVEVGGKVYTLRFSIKAMAALQEHFQLPSLNDLQGAMAKVGAGDVAGVIWAGLRTHHPEVTKDQAMEIADDLGLEGAMQLLNDGFGAAMPEGEGEADPRSPGR